METLRIKECQGFDPQTKTDVIWFEVWVKLEDGQIEKRIVSDLKDLEAAE